MTLKPKRWLWALALSPLLIPPISGFISAGPSTRVAIAAAVIIILSVLMIGRDAQIIRSSGYDLGFRGLRFLMPPVYLWAREKSQVRVLAPIWVILFLYCVLPAHVSGHISLHLNAPLCSDPAVRSAIMSQWADPTERSARAKSLLWLEDRSSAFSTHRSCFGVIEDTMGMGTYADADVSRRIDVRYHYQDMNDIQRLSPSAPLGCDKNVVKFSVIQNVMASSKATGIKLVGLRMTWEPGDMIRKSCTIIGQVSDGTFVRGTVSIDDQGPINALKSTINMDYATRYRQ